MPYFFRKSSKDIPASVSKVGITSVNLLRNAMAAMTANEGKRINTIVHLCFPLLGKIVYLLLCVVIWYLVMGSDHLAKLVGVTFVGENH